jgi:hypothetical protein
LSFIELFELRIRAGELIYILYDKRETVRRDRIQYKAYANIIVKEESPGPDPFPLLIERTYYSRYIGDKSLSYEERTFNYYRSTIIYDYFDRVYAK